ncbi:MAG: chemotaxis protein CheD [Acetobacteraceae bacterium]
MNHFLLPRCGDAIPSPRYGDVAFAHLIAAMRKRGCQPADLRAKVFGGAAVLPFSTQTGTIGTQNSASHSMCCGHMAYRWSPGRTGGQRGLFLRFHTALGLVLVRELAGGAGVDCGAAIPAG